MDSAKTPFKIRVKGRFEYIEQAVDKEKSFD